MGAQKSKEASRTGALGYAGEVPALTASSVRSAILQSGISPLERFAIMWQVSRLEAEILVRNRGGAIIPEGEYHEAIDLRRLP